MALSGLCWALSVLAVANAFPLDPIGSPLPEGVTVVIGTSVAPVVVADSTTNSPSQPIIIGESTPIPPTPETPVSTPVVEAESTTDSSSAVPASVTPVVAESTVHHDVRKVAGPAAAEGLRICTWNIFRFGSNKFNEPDEFLTKYGKNKLTMIVEQISNCDILAMQEFFDESEGVLKQVRDGLNTKTGSVWNYTISNRVGRTSKEQYVFLYRTEVAKAGAYSEAPDPQDVYSRDPFFTNFKITKAGISLKNITLGTIHTEPAKAVEEMNGLVDTYPWAEKLFGTPDVMVLGDYNGDCQYVRKSEWPNVKLSTDTNFKWLIPTGTDTASMNSECTFDRAVVKSANFKKSFVEGSLKVLDFVTDYKIDVKEARKLSDHFPVLLIFK